ncbi:MAG: TetR/AcrR family transcriptional regulator [Phycisphaeraceae bacterium]|nr:TetR/AcrR family transcriptional regulator [Phycisphaeraceae bacterium]
MPQPIPTNTTSPTHTTPGQPAAATLPLHPDPASLPSKERILHAARRLFHEQGFHATGMSTILREADVNSGTLYHFFPGKSALLVGVLQLYTALLRPIIIDPVEARSADPVERIFILLENYRDGMAAQDFRMGCPIGNLALEVADDDPQAREWIARNFDGWTAAVREWLEQARPRFKPDADLDGLANFILTVMEGGLMQARALKSRAPIDHAIDQLRAYVNLLIIAPASHAPPPNPTHT